MAKINVMTIQAFDKQKQVVPICTQAGEKLEYFALEYLRDSAYSTKSFEEAIGAHQAMICMQIAEENSADPLSKPPTELYLPLIKNENAIEFKNPKNSWFGGKATYTSACGNYTATLQVNKANR